MTISSFRDLDVWKDAVELASTMYRATREFPVEERYGLTAQLRRSSTSIASNIAEGHARNSTREFIQFVAIALGSLAEVETQWEIANRVLASDGLDESVAQRISHLRARLLNLRAALLRRTQGVSDDMPIYDLTAPAEPTPSAPLHLNTDAPGLPESALPVPRAPCPVPLQLNRPPHQTDASILPEPALPVPRAPCPVPLQLNRPPHQTDASILPESALPVPRAPCPVPLYP